jgi:hypothetical protein
VFVRALLSTVYLLAVSILEKHKVFCLDGSFRRDFHPRPGLLQFVAGRFPGNRMVMDAVLQVFRNLDYEPSNPAQFLYELDRFAGGHSASSDEAIAQVTLKPTSDLHAGKPPAINYQFARSENN